MPSKEVGRDRHKIPGKSRENQEFAESGPIFHASCKQQTRVAGRGVGFAQKVGCKEFRVSNKAAVQPEGMMNKVKGVWGRKQQVSKGKSVKWEFVGGSSGESGMEGKKSTDCQYSVL